MKRSARVSLLAGLLSLLVATVASSGPPVRGGPVPAPLPILPPDSWWNVDVSQAPLEPSFTRFDFFGRNAAMHPDFGGDAEPPPGTDIYGMPYVVVDGDQPLEQVDFSQGYEDQSDAGAPGRPPGYPIPVEARTQGKWIEGGAPGGGTSGDRHLLILDRGNRFLFELYATRWDGAKWFADSGAVWPLDVNLRRPEGWTSADAAGLAILPGLVRYDEVYGADEIRHAFRFTTNGSLGHVFPASHTASSGSGANRPPMGLRLRMKASVDISHVPEPVRKIFRAMKKYGLILADNGTDMYVQGTYDTRWDNDILNPAFRSFRAADFEVVELGWISPSLDPLTGPIVVGDSLTLNGLGFRAGSVVKLYVATAAGVVDHGPYTPSSYGPTSLSVDLPASVPLGNGFATVQVVNTDQGWASSSARGQLVYGSPPDNLPTVLSVGGVPLRAFDPSIPTANVETLVLPGTTVTLSGTGFNAPLVNLFTAAGNTGPLAPLAGGSATSLQVVIPAGTPTGPGSFQVVNAPYTGNVQSNAVSAPVGALVTVTEVSVDGSTVTVNGTGFCPLTVINLFNLQGDTAVNLGGLNGDGSSKIPMTIVSSTRLTFEKPAGAAAGPSFVEVLNPPFIPYSSSGHDLDGAFVLP
jgi:hypothetical protein